MGAGVVAGAHGITARELLPYALATANEMPCFLNFCAKRIDAGDHGGDVGRLAMGAASVEHVVHTSKAAGVDDTLPAALAETFRRGVAEGHGVDSCSSLVTVFRQGAAQSSRSAS